MEKTREWKQYLMVILGSALFAASVNLLIVPLSLYSAGIVGIAQILRTLLVPLMPFAAGFDVAGIINLLLNIPLFLLAFRSISRDRKSTRLNSSHWNKSRMPSSA